jgi:hypothetical protein
MPGPHGGYDPNTRERWECRYCKKNTLDERTLKLSLKECASCDRLHQVCSKCFRDSIGKVYSAFPNYEVKLRKCPKEGAIMSEPIDRFLYKYHFLSNFFPSAVTFEKLSYPTIEHAYQAAKTLDPVERERIRNYEKPGQAKRRGKKVVLRTDWEQIKFKIMEDLVRQKFTDNSNLRSWLLETGDRPLIEMNTWGDRIWGVDEQGVGENHLGRILMKVRDELRKK